jgi:hypothetical protein
MMMERLVLVSSTRSIPSYFNVLFQQKLMNAALTMDVSRFVPTFQEASWSVGANLLTSIVSGAFINFC